MIDINHKYKPQYFTELEQEYPKIEQFLKSNKTFIVNGTKYCGKSTIVKLYLKKLNYDYLLIDDFNQSKESIIDKIKYRTNSVLSYFYKKKFTIIIDNFDNFDTTIKDYIINDSNTNQYVIITTKFIHIEMNYVRINNYSYDYMCDLYIHMYFLEKNVNPIEIPEFENINQMFTILEFNLCTINNKIEENKETKETNETKETTVTNELTKSNYQSQNTVPDYKLFFDKFEYHFNDLVIEKNFNKKLYILDKFDSYNTFHNNLIYNYKSIDNLADSYDYLSSSLYFNNNNNSKNSSSSEYYSILSIIGTTYKLDNFQIKKENFQIKKKLKKKQCIL